MKNKIKYILTGCCLMTTFSCSDFLERYPLDKAVNDTYWKTEAQLQLCKSARGGLAVVFVRTAAQPQRIDVIKYCFVIPSHDHSLPFYCSKKLHRPQGGSNSIPHPLANMCIFADFCQDSLRLSANVPVKRLRIPR